MQKDELIVDDSIINSLRLTIQQERELLKIKKNILREIDQKEEEFRLSRLEQLLSFLYFEKLRRDFAQIKELKVDFLEWETAPTIEALNFLLTEFFVNNYPGKEWDKNFIADLVFEITRVVNFISNLKK